MTLLNYAPPLNPYLTVVYRDDDLVVLDKPAGLLSVPGKDPAHLDSLWYRASRVWPGLRVVHRLDMATSGLILFALNKPAQVSLNRQFEQRLVTKEYRARVWGQLAEREGSINHPMRCDWPNRPRQMVDTIAGKPALTHYQQLSEADSGSGSGTATDVALFPHTGRSHQLRVHMQALGHPILGDKFYAHDEAFHAADRLLLHAHQIAFLHPLTEQPVSFISPVPF